MKPPVKQIILLFCLAVLVGLFGKPVLAAEETNCGAKVDCCSKTFLKTHFGDEAGNAAKVCEKASQGSPFASTLDEGRNENSCFKKGGTELGIGLFLINIYKTNLAPGALSESDGKCVVADQEKLNEIGGKLLDPVINAQTAAQLYKNNVVKDNCGWEWSSVAKDLKICGDIKEADKIPGAGGIVTGDETGGKGTEKPEKVSLGIAELITNFYKWALGIGGLIALAVLIFGGILYTISAGNASRQGDARQWISGALIGILLLFGSYLVLNTINPELTKLKDLELIVNEAAQGIRGVEDVPFTEGPNCDGYYTGYKALKGNFADPGCEGAITAGNPNGLDQFKDKVYRSLVQLDPEDANDLFAIIPCESAGTWSPNIWRNPILEPHTPNPTGAWGLFQMGSVARHNDYGNECYDIGQSHWTKQVENSVCVIKAVKASGKNPSAYWPTWGRCP